MPERDAIAGRLIDGGHELIQRVYFEDTDFSGRVYHARYLHFMERGRSDYLRLLGVHHRELAAEGARLRRPPHGDRFPRAGGDRRRADHPHRPGVDTAARGSCSIRRF